MGAGGIPHCLLVDTTGTIVWTGHPSSIPLEERMDELLTGKNPFADSADGASSGDGGPPMGDKSGEDAAAWKASYDKVAQAVIADTTLKTNAKGLQCFFVLVTNGQFDEASGSMKYNAQLHTLAVPGRGGPTEGLKPAQESLAKHTEAIRADFEA